VTEQTFDFETATAGTQVTTASTIGASSVTTSGGTVKIDNTCVGNGTRNILMTVTTANTVTIARFNVNASLVQSFGGWFTTPATPTANLTIHAPRYSGGPVFRVNWGTNNALTTGDFSGATANPITIATGLTPGARYYLAYQLTIATPTTGQIALQVYDSAGALIGSGTSSSYNLGTTAMSAMDVGVVSTMPVGRSVAWDYVQVNDGSTTPYVPAGGSVTVTAPTGTTIRGTSGAAVSAGVVLAVPVGTATRGSVGTGVMAGVSVTAPTATLNRAGVNPSLGAGVLLSAPSGAVTNSGVPPTVSAGSRATLTPPVAAITRTAAAPNILAGVTLAAPVASRVWAAASVSVLAGATVQAPTGGVLRLGVPPAIVSTVARDITVYVSGPTRHQFKDASPLPNPLRVSGGTR